jgi:protocatechuate 3,4-dioxygenase beta subunit
MTTTDMRGDARPTIVPTYEGRPLPHPDEPVFDQGLGFDVQTLLDRRSVMKGLGFGSVAVALAACAPTGATTAPAGTPLTSSGATPASPDSAECAVIPEETAGPYPGDGSNGPNVLAESGVVRSDITASFGTSTTVAGGVPLTIRLAIQDAGDGCSPAAGTAVYVWHCDREGRYSMYSPGAENENYLRGVQEAGEDGVATFTSIFPACYSGRWPHIHFEVFPSLDAANDDANRIATSQIALPEDVSNAVYATAGYEQSVQNMTQVSLQRDNVFGEDGGAQQLGTIEGSAEAGYTVTLAVPVQL